MALRQIVSFIFKPFVDVRSWLGYDHIKSSGQFIMDLLRRFLNLHKKSVGDSESFTDAMHRLRLSNEDLKRLEKSYLRHTLIYLGFTILIAAYTAHLLYQAAYFAAGISFLICCLGLLSAFRAHFWVFQIRSRMLGCSLKSWFSYLIKRQGSV